MTRDSTPDGEITSPRAFETALNRLIRRAHHNGVAVEGGWECRNGVETPDWDAVILELAKGEETDG